MIDLNKYVTRKGKLVQLHFDRCIDACKLIEERDVRGEYQERYAACKSLLLNGWPEGRERALAMHKKVWDCVARELETDSISRAESGFEVDMGRYLEGAPECMFENRVSDQPSVLVDFFISVCYSGGISSELIFNRGAAILALIDALEARGKRCQIQVYDTGDSATQRVECYFGVKESGERLDIDRAAFMFCHPDFLRAFCFAVYEAVGNCGAGYHLPCAVLKVPEHAVHMPEMMYGDKQWKTVDSCVEWVMQELKKQGVEINT